MSHLPLPSAATTTTYSPNLEIVSPNICLSSLPHSCTALARSWITTTPRESFSSDDEDEQFEDYLTVGNVIGEMGILTSKPRNATVICETTVQVKYPKNMKNVFHLGILRKSFFPSDLLISNMWPWCMAH